MYKPGMVSKILVKNMKKFKNPIGVNNWELNSWWRVLNVKKSGRRLLFTGMMYQLAPYIAAITDKLYSFENTFFESLISTVSFVPSLTKVFFKPIEADLQRFNRILLNIYSILLKSVEFCYNPKIDFYSGILLYDLGLDDIFERHARNVVETLEKNGVKEIITIDPHTTYALKELYPEYVGVEYEVFNYLEIARAGFKDEGCVTLHDPCYYARYLDIYDQPREILSSAGFECMDVRNSKKMTYCCGAPIESLSPKLAKEIAKIRFSELKETGCKIVTLCPLCLVSLKSFGNVYDIAEVLGEFNDKATC